MNFTHTHTGHRRGHFVLRDEVHFVRPEIDIASARPRITFTFYVFHALMYEYEPEKNRYFRWTRYLPRSFALPLSLPFYVCKCMWCATILHESGWARSFLFSTKPATRMIKVQCRYSLTRVHGAAAADIRPDFCVNLKSNTQNGKKRRGRNRREKKPGWVIWEDFARKWYFSRHFFRNHSAVNDISISLISHHVRRYRWMAKHVGPRGMAFRCLRVHYMQYLD